jgi:hypothetical protein
MSESVKGCRTPAGLAVATGSSAGVGQAPREETAGGLCRVVLRAMGIVLRGLTAELIVSASGHWHRASTVVYRDRRRGFFSHDGAGILPGQWG